ncbi:SDR family NAD(P)-dependent oxidoreductase [Nitrosopumilus adriaticus]|uniref:SDR family NAD(P)-dependent oxidoreductase n=1 Tax=Nitrosopumilus adriaticus TaxID=1580092 RepID=UPI00352E3BC5
MKKTNFPNNKVSKLLKNKTILITGGAGSVGSKLAERILDFQVRQVRIIDINEHALFQLKRELNDSRLRILFGSITDKERLEIAGKNVDIIIHAAALKNIEITEFNAIDTININVNGTVNMIKMAIKNEPAMFLNISTDKAAGSSTIYGTTKELGEKITTWAKIHFKDTKFASVRFGNVIETRGNVFEVWEKENKDGKPLSITNPDMKRYFFHINEAVNFVLECLTKINDGTVFIPKMKAYKIKELAEKISKKHKVIGLRPGEKMEEVLITDEERKNAFEEKEMWILKLKNNMSGF